VGPRDLPNFLGFPCDKPYNDGPHHYVFHAAIDALNRWVTKGELPPVAPRLEVTGPPETAVRDRFGNALGGIRTPQLDVPVATLSGVGNTSASGPFCGLFGVTTPFTPEQLNELYPTERSFTKPFAAATRSAVKAGFLLREDAREILGRTGDDDRDDD
jgi:Alpha/beta hydrolase domain